MQSLTVSGGLGRDSELRSTHNGDQVLSFNVGSSQGFGDKKQTNWFRCSVWGKRAEKLHLYLLKGVKVVVQGELSIGEYEGKPQYEVRVNEVEFMSRGEGQPARQDQQRQAPAFDADLDDDVPF